MKEFKAKTGKDGIDAEKLSLSENEVSRQCRENKEAVIITVNGRGDTLSPACEEQNCLKAGTELSEMPALAFYNAKGRLVSMTGDDTQQRLAAFIERETECWDFWGTIRIVKGGSILWETSRGYACAEFGVKNRISSLGGEGFQVHPSASIPVYL